MGHQSASDKLLHYFFKLNTSWIYTSLASKNMCKFQKKFHIRKSVKREKSKMLSFPKVNCKVNILILVPSLSKDLKTRLLTAIVLLRLSNPSIAWGVSHRPQQHYQPLYRDNLATLGSVRLGVRYGSPAAVVGTYLHWRLLNAEMTAYSN